MSRISAHEQSILHVFSDEYAFCIPNYQRPYRWGVDQAEQLFRDVLESALESRPYLEKKGASELISPYFLGSIVLIKEEGKPEADVVDGQQRLTTLSLLLAALRSILPAEEAEDISGLLFEKGSKLKGTKDRCRLSLRERDHGFYQAHVLEDKSLGKLAEVAIDSITEPQANIVRNAGFFLAELLKLNAGERALLATYLLQHTYLVIVATESLDSAFRIFSVLNDRGLDLTSADILKADIIGKIQEEKQAIYTRKWEDTDEVLGADDFDKLISYIVMIHHRQKVRETVLKTFRSVVNAEARPMAFIDEELLPYADGYETIQQQDWEGDPAFAKLINAKLRHLRRLDNSNWIPPTLMLLEKLKSAPEKLLQALTDLERLAVVMWLNKTTENDRIDRYGNLMGEIDKGTDLIKSTYLQLRAMEQQTAINVLSGDIYNLSPKQKRTMILLRLDELLGSGEASYSEEQITIEHILPQTPPNNSEWLQWWPDEKARGAATHHIGNLALLNRRQNSAAKNWDFAKKKEKYFKTRGGASPFLLTNEVLAQETWTPEVFQERQARFVKTLCDAWRLKSLIAEFL